MRFTTGIFLLLLIGAATALSAQPDILYYKFNETAGSNASNHAVPGQGANPAIFSAPPVWNTTDPAVGGACADNNGLSRELPTSYSMSERNGEDFTIEFWFRSTDNDTFALIIGDATAWGVYFNNGRMLWWLGPRPTSGNYLLVSQPNVNDGTWHHFAGTYDASAQIARMYIDGVLRDTENNCTPTFGTRNSHMFHWGGAWTFDGEIDEFRLWSTVRTSSEINANMNTEFTQEVEVYGPEGQFLPDEGDYNVKLVPSTGTDYQFTVVNTTGSNLNFRNGPHVQVNQENDCVATLLAQPADPIPPGGSVTFTVNVVPTNPSDSTFSFRIRVRPDASPNSLRNYQIFVSGTEDTGLPEIAYYRFNEGSGSSVANDADPGDGDDPALFSAAPNWNTTTPQLGTAAVNNSNSRNLPTGVNASSLGGQDFTIEFWMRTTTNSGTQCMVGDGTSFTIYLVNGGLRVYTTGQFVAVPATVNNGVWHHVAVVIMPGAGGLTVYVDGLLALSDTNFSVDFADTETTVLSYGGGFNYTGEMDEFRWWCHARTFAQINANMNRELLADIDIQRPANNTIPHNTNDTVTGAIAGQLTQLTYTIENTGAADLTLDPTAVVLSANTNCTVSTTQPSTSVLASGATTTFVVNITPSSVGAFSVRITVGSDDDDEPSYIIDAIGSATGGGEIDIQRPVSTSIADGGNDTQTGGVAGAVLNLTYTIENLGTANLTMPTNPVSVANLVNCGISITQPATLVLGSSATTTFNLAVTPTNAGGFSFNLDVTSDDLDEANYDIAFSATAAVGGEIDIQRPVSTSIADGGNDTQTGTVAGVQFNLTYTIENLGTATLTMPSNPVSVSGLSNCAVTITQPTTLVLGVSGTTTFQLAVTPTNAGNFSFDIDVASDDLNEGNYDIAFSASAAVGGEIDIQRPVSTSISDGGNDTQTGTVAGVQFNLTYTIENLGTATLTMPSNPVSVSGLSNCAVSITQPATLALGVSGTTTFTLAVTPTNAGNFSFDIDVASDDLNEGNYDIAFSASAAVGGEIDIQRPVSTSISDGGNDTESGTVAGVQFNLTYTIENLGTATLTMPSNPVSVSGLSNCAVTITQPATLALGANATTTFQLAVTPTNAGAFSFDIDVASDDLNEGNYDIAFSATAAVGGEIDIQRPISTSISDGGNDTQTGAAATNVLNLTYTIENLGTATLTLPSNSVSVTNLVNCGISITQPATLALGVSGTTTFNLAVTPATPGTFSFDIDVASDDLNEGNYDIAFSATAATAQTISVTTPVDYGASPVGSLSANSPIQHTIQNTGGAPLTITAIALSGTHAGDWALSGLPSFPAVIAPSGQIQITGNLTPSAVGIRTAAIDITSNTGGVPNTNTPIAISGEGVPTASVANLLVAADSAGPVQIAFQISSAAASVDVRLTYAGGSNGGTQAVLAGSTHGVIDNDYLRDVPTNRVVKVWWDAYATEGHTTANNYVVTLTSYVGVTPNATISSNAFALARDGGFATHDSTEISAPDRHSHSMIYDSANDRFVAFGGHAHVSHPRDISVFVFRRADNRIVPEALTPTGTPPAGRTYHGAVYDAVNGRMIVFGGVTDSGVVNDVWALDLTLGSESWTQLTPSGTPPAARAYSAFEIDPVTNTAWLFGGWDGSTSYADVWRLNLTLGSESWVLVPTTGGPAGRWGMQAVMDTAGTGTQRLIIHSGSHFGNHTDLWALDVSTGSPTWTQLSQTGAPSAISSGTAVYDANRDVMVVAGGSRGHRWKDEVYELSLGATQTWTLVSPTRGEGLGHGAAAFDTTRNQVLFYGGRTDGTPGNTNRTCVWDGTVWLDLGTPFGSSGLPMFRQGASMVYDSTNNRVILFGGVALTHAFNDVWQLDLSLTTPTWSKLSPLGLDMPETAFHSAVFDATNQRMMVFGGRQNGALSNRVFALDLTFGSESWSEIMPFGTSPDARFEHATAYDSANNAMLIFGGTTPSSSNNIDTWELDLTLGLETWTPFSYSGATPSGIRGGVAAFDASANRLLIVSGYSGGVNTNDVWALDTSMYSGATWTNVTPGSGPSARSMATSAVVGNRLYLHGGRNGSVDYNDLWELDFSSTSPTWTDISPTVGEMPIPAMAGAMCATGGGELYVGFGVNDRYHPLEISDAWSIDTLTPALGWTRIGADVAPRDVSGAAVAFDPVGQRWIFFGGNKDATATDETWQLDLSGATPVWTRIDSLVSPLAVTGATMTYDPVGARMILFAGRKQIGLGQVTDQLWQFDLGTNQWSQLTPTVTDDPGARYGHSAVYDPTNHRIVVFAGMGTQSQLLNDLYQLDLTTMTWSALVASGTPPSTRTGAISVYDAVNQRMVIFSGRGNGWLPADNTTYQLTLTGTPTWSVVSVSGTPPTGRYSTQFAHDTTTNRVYVFGGRDSQNGAYRSDLWRFDLGTNTWTEILSPMTALRGRSGHTSVWDAANNRMTIIGGEASWTGSGKRGARVAGWSHVETWFWGE